MRPATWSSFPSKTRADIAVGRVKGTYQYRTDLTPTPLHTRSVEWLKEFPRSAFDKDLLFSFGAVMTVCRIERNSAKQRVEAMLNGKPPALAVARLGANEERRSSPDRASDKTDETALPDIEEQSRDLIRERIAQRYKGHSLVTLIAAILEAQGYRTRTSPPGADGGVDIMAGTGPLGFDTPRLIVQVKSQDARVDSKILRELTGVMARFHADHALLVGWGGFTQSARTEAAPDYFRLRLWDAGDVIRAVQTHYESLPEDIRAELPLKRVWTLVPDDESV